MIRIPTKQPVEWKVRGFFFMAQMENSIEHPQILEVEQKGKRTNTEHVVPVFGGHSLGCCMSIYIYIHPRRLRCGS